MSVLSLNDGIFDISNHTLYIYESNIVLTQNYGTTGGLTEISSNMFSLTNSNINITDNYLGLDNTWTGRNEFKGDISFINTNLLINSSDTINLSGGTINISGGAVNISGGSISIGTSDFSITGITSTADTTAVSYNTTTKKLGYVALPAAPSTLLASNNTWTGKNQFNGDVSLNSITTLTSDIYATTLASTSDANAVSYNPTTKKLGYVALPAAPSTLLASNNTWTGKNQFNGDVSLNSITSLTSDIYATALASTADTNAVSYNTTTKKLGYVALPAAPSTLLASNNTWTGTQNFKADVSFNQKVSLATNQKLCFRTNDTNSFITYDGTGFSLSSDGGIGLKYNNSSKIIVLDTSTYVYNQLSIGSISNTGANTGLQLYGSGATVAGIKEMVITQRDTNAGTGKKNWQMGPNGDIYQFYTSDDTYGTANTFLSFLRKTSGAGVSNIVFTCDYIGINNTNPAYPLDVGGNARIGVGDAYLINLGQSGVGGFRSAFIYGDGTNMEISNQQTGAMKFNTANTERMRITATGNVGIGTTNPNFKTSINYSGQYTSATAPNKNFGLEIYNSEASASSNRPNLILFTDSNSTQAAIGGYRVNYNADYRGGLVFYCANQPTGYTQGTPANTTQASNPLTEMMRITPSGNVGIGTASPTTKLHVVGVPSGETNYAHEDVEWGDYDGSIYKKMGALGTEDGTSFNSGALYLYQNTTTKAVKISANGLSYLNGGNVGIGTTTPKFPLHIVGGASPINTFLGSFVDNSTFTTSSNGRVYYSYFNAVGSNFAGQGYYNGRDGLGWGIFVNTCILAAEFDAYSDTRIKTNIVDIDDEKALLILRKIQPTTYEYVDKFKRGNDNVIGFIAQEIKEIIPKAVKINIDYAPTFYTVCQITTTDASNILLVTSHIDLSWNSLHDQSGNAFIDADGNACSDASGNKVFKIKLYDQSNNEITCKTTNVLDKRSFLMDITGTKMLDSSGNLVLEKDGGYFLYGQEIDDFHTLDKNAIFTVVTAAVQDIDRQVQASQMQIQASQTQIQASQTQIQASQMQIQASQMQIQADKIKIQELENKVSTYESRIEELEKQNAQQKEQIAAILARLGM